MSWNWMAMGSLATIIASYPSIVGAADPSQPLPILDGMEAPQCAWPNVVNLTDVDGVQWCTGTLIHPLIVVTAAHCISEIAHVSFGEGPDNLVEPAAIEYCVENPDFVGGTNGLLLDNTDFGFCKLQTPVENVPIIPIAYGCELDQLVQGTPLAAIGFGDDENMADTVKRFVELSVVGFQPDGEIHVDRGPCFGDSGGPTMIQLDDGSWRQVGIHSYVADFDCTSGFAAAAWQVLPFIEAHAGIDVTPCHDVAGEWAPQGACQGVPLAPFVGGAGDYMQGCPAGAVTEFVATCGDPLDANPDDAAPIVAFVEPKDGAQLETDGMTVPVEIAADDGTGWGVVSVDLIVEAVDGESMTATSSYPPWQWNVALPEGAYYFGASALDYAEHRSDTVWIAVGIGVPAPPPRAPEPMETSSESGAPTDTSGSSAGDADGTTSTGETTGVPEQQGDGDRGCSCRSTASPASLSLVLLLVGLRRRATRR